MDNLRTLCVACHADVTKAQTKERAAARQQEKAARGGGGGGGSVGWGDVELEYQAGGSEDGSEGRPVVRRRARAGKLYVEDSDDGSKGSNGDGRDNRGGQGAGKRQAAAGGAAARQPVQRRRARLKPLMVESEDGEVGETAGADPTSAHPGPGSTAAAAAGAGSRPLQRRRRKLVPLFGDSEEGEADWGSKPEEAAPATDTQPAAAGQRAAAAPPPVAARGEAAVAPAQPVGQLHRLARSSTAEEPGPVAPEGGAAGAACAAAAGDELPLTSGGANVLQGGAQKRPRVTAAAKGGAVEASTLAAAEPACRPAKGRAVLDADDWPR